MQPKVWQKQMWANSDMVINYKKKDALSDFTGIKILRYATKTNLTNTQQAARHFASTDR